MNVRTLNSGPDALAIERRPTLSARLAAAAERGWHTYRQARAQRAALLLLSSLDERTLRDIGISRDEIQSAVYGAPDRIRSYAPRSATAAERLGDRADDADGH